MLVALGFWRSASLRAAAWNIRRVVLAMSHESHRSPFISHRGTSSRQCLQTPQPPVGPASTRSKMVWPWSSSSSATCAAAADAVAAALRTTNTVAA